MFDAQVLLAGSDIYTPWVPRGGDNFIATLDVIDIDNATITIRTFTKNSEETGDGTDADASTTIARTTVGRSQAEWNGVLDEWVRLKISVTGQDGKWVLFRMLNPIWFDSVEA